MILSDYVHILRHDECSIFAYAQVINAIIVYAAKQVCLNRFVFPQACTNFPDFNRSFLNQIVGNVGIPHKCCCISTKLLMQYLKQKFKRKLITGLDVADQFFVNDIILGYQLLDKMMVSKSQTNINVLGKQKQEKFL